MAFGVFLLRNSLQFKKGDLVEYIQVYEPSIVGPEGWCRMETGWIGIVKKVTEISDSPNPFFDNPVHPVKVYVYWTKMKRVSWAMPESLKKLNK